MKKIVTLFCCTTVFASAFAQTQHRDWDDRNRDGNSYGNSNNNQVYKNDHDRNGKADRDDRRFNNNSSVYQNNTSGISQRDMQIQRISRQYDYRIQQVSYDRSLSRREKKNAVKALEAQKAQRINAIYSQYNSNVYNDSHKRNNDYKNKHNNGYGRYNR